MDLKEVENSYFEYEDKKHKLLQEAQAHFLKLGFRPYVWIDDRNRLVVKEKHERTGPNIRPIGKISNFIEECDIFAEKNGLIIKFIHETGEIDRRLAHRIQEVWSTEVIFEV